MKQVTLMGGKVKFVEDDEADNIKKSVNTVRFVELRDGSAVNVSSIVSIDEVDTIPYWSVFPVNETKNGKYIIRDGLKFYLDPENIEEIEYRVPENVRKRPDYVAIENKQKLLQ